MTEEKDIVDYTTSLIIELQTRMIEQPNKVDIVCNMLEDFSKSMKQHFKDKAIVVKETEDLVKRYRSQ